MLHTQTNHWPDGTPRSTGNAFDVLYTGRTVPIVSLTKADIQAERKRQIDRKAYQARKVKRSCILRDNHNHSFCTTIPTAADNAKTARIRGRL